jgi:hypothetical protein
MKSKNKRLKYTLTSILLVFLPVHSADLQGSPVLPTGTPAASTAKPKEPTTSKNLILGDSDAETEIKELTKGTYGYSNGTAEWDQTTGYCGSSSVKVSRESDAPVYKYYFQPGQVSTKPVKNLKIGQAYTFSFYAKAEKEGTIANIAIKQFFWKEEVSKDIVLGKEWKRFEITITPQKKWSVDDANRYVLCYGLQKPGVAWFDAFQFEEGAKATPYANAIPARISVHVNSSNKNTFRSDEKCLVDLNVFQTSGTAANALSVKYIVQDYSGKKVDEKTVPVEIGADGRWSQQITLPSDQLGWFLVTAQLYGDKVLIQGDQASLVIVAPPVETAPGAKPFCGIDEKHLDIAFSTETLQKIGFKWVAVYADWGAIEKAKGVYDWNAKNRMEDQINAFKKQGYRIKVMFEGFPDWSRSQSELAESHQLGKGYSDRLLPDESNIEEWRRFMRNFVARFKDKIDLYEIGGEVDAKYGLNPYYQKKYPEGIVKRAVAGKLADRYSKLVSVGAEEIKKQVPDAEIGAIRPCDVDCSDFNYTFPFSREIFKRCGKEFNVFPLDPYPRPRHIGAEYPVSGSALNLKRVVRGAEKVIEEFGNHQPIYISEYGAFIDHRLVRDFHYTSEQIKNLTTSYLTARALKLTSFFWYTDITDSNAVEANYYYMGIWYEDEPLPAVAAFSTVAQILENSVESTLMDLNSNLKAAAFKKADGSATAGIWASETPSGIYFSETDSRKIVVTDVMGNVLLPQTKQNQRYFPIDATPIYFRKSGEGDNFQELCAAVKQMKMDGPHLAQISFRIIDESKGKLSLVNASGSGVLTGTIRHKIFGKGSTEDVAIPGAGKYLIDIEIPSGLPAGEVLVVEASFNGGNETETLTFEIPAIVPVAKLDVPPDMDQAPGDWNIPPCIVMDNTGYLFPHDPHTAWDGAKDLSAKIYMGWIEQDLHIGAVVTDDVHANNNDRNLYDADSFQFAFDPKNDASDTSKKGGYSDDDIELVAALTDRGPAALESAGLNKEVLKNAKYTVVRNEKAGTTTYHLRIPLADLSLVPGKAFGFNAVVFDDDSGTGQSYHLRYTEGIANKKDPKAFKKFILKN